MTTGQPQDLVFVDPDETDDTYRVCLWAAPGQGKSVAAASAPGPLLVLSADRPSAYKYARKHHAGKELHEVRYRDFNTLNAVLRHLRAHPEIKTLIVDPVSSIYDQLVDTAPQRSDGDPDYQRVNKALLGFVQGLRPLDINVVLVAHEKLNDGKKGDGKLYPALGGPALINKLLAEMDIVAQIQRHVSAGEDGEEVVRWVGQLQPRDNLVCKESTGALGDRRIADLTRWFALASESLAPVAGEATGAVPAEVVVAPEPAAEEPAPKTLTKEECGQLVDLCAARGHEDLTMLLTAVGADSIENLTHADRDAILAKLLELPGDDATAVAA